MVSPRFRRGFAVPLKPIVDEAVSGCPDLRTVLVVRATGAEVARAGGRDLWWHDAVARQSGGHTAEAHDAERPLNEMRTSGATAKSEGILRTSCAYLTRDSLKLGDVRGLACQAAIGDQLREFGSAPACPARG